MEKIHLNDALIRSCEELSSQLRTRYMGKRLKFFESVSSTNTSSFNEAIRGAAHGTVVLADVQTSGRGRKGRVWHSPPGKNLYFSILLTELPERSGISWVPLVTGLALAETLEDASRLSLSLKWPNDIVIKNKKIAGILCESKQIGQQDHMCVVGVGINVNSHYNDFPAGFSEIGTSLSIECQSSFHRSAILRTFLEKFESYYETLLQSGSHSIKRLYANRCATIGRQIRLELMTGEAVQGFAVGIGDEGELLMAVPDTSSPHSLLKVREGDVIHVR